MFPGFFGGEITTKQKVTQRRDRRGEPWRMSRTAPGGTRRFVCARRPRCVPQGCARHRKLWSVTCVSVWTRTSERVLVGFGGRGTSCEGPTCVSPEVLARGRRRHAAQHEHGGQKEPVWQPRGLGTDSHPGGKGQSRVQSVGEAPGQRRPEDGGLLPLPRKRKGPQTWGALGGDALLYKHLVQ